MRSRPPTAPTWPLPLVLLAVGGVLALRAAGGLAAPAPQVLRVPPAARTGLADAATPHGPGAVCAARADAAAAILAAHLARPASVPQPTTYSTDTNGIAVLEDDGTFFFSDKNNNVNLDLAAVSQAFYRDHGDDYDVLAIYLASGLTAWLGSPTAVADANLVRNAVQGIGLETFDVGAGFGSPARLRTLLCMNGLQNYLDDPNAIRPGDTFSELGVLAHEFGHSWLAYTWVDSAGSPSPALLGRDYQHWGFFFDSDSSFMEGNDWARAGPDSFVTDGSTDAFGTLDLYLMGLITHADIDSFFVVNDPANLDPPGNYVPGSGSQRGVGCDGVATWWRIADIEAANGPRVPDGTAAPHAFRMATILVTPHGAAPTAADLTKLGALRAAFGPAFATATRGRGSVDLSLDSRAGQVVIAHRPLPDTEDGLSPRPVGARVAIAQGGIPLTLDASSVRAYVRASGGAYTPVAFSPAGPDSFAGMLPAYPTGTDVEYYLFAASDSTGIDATDPPAGGAAPHRYHVGPDLTPPVIVRALVPAQGAGHLPQTVLARVTDNVGVDSVWVEWSVNGGVPGSTPATPAGRDSFAASLPLAQPGQRIAWRFAALDRALAHNLAYSNPGFDTLVVLRDWFSDFENGPEGFFSAPQWYSYRDAWHLTDEDASPAGGTSWKCGAWGPGDYAPHLDSNLYSPVLDSLPSGTVLRFDHRYDLEQSDSVFAFDGARVEGQVSGGSWQILTPTLAYGHQFASNSNPFQMGAPCWSGHSGGWRTETVDLTPLAPGPARIRFRMLADDFIGDQGWFVDRVRIQFPGEPTAAGPASPRLAIGRPWPNPARGVLRLSLTLAAEARAEWALVDIAGRRACALWSGTVPRGGFELAARLPALAPGLYFARLKLDGRVAATHRVAIVR